MVHHTNYRWRDPFAGCPLGAVLLSDQIYFLADEIKLIEPFRPNFLRPASYDLHVGDVYFVNDEPRPIDDAPVEIPPHGLIYVKTLEKFNLPYYLVARYSLQVQQVYRGLLIDNGLHIDPGYCGHIWIPIHNFTTQPRTLRKGQEFISVEFNLTTRLPKDVSSIESEDQLVRLGIANELKGVGNRPIKVFFKDEDRYLDRHKDFTPRLFWDKFPGEKHQSAMLETEQRLKEVRTDVDQKLSTIRNLGILAILGFVIGLLGILLPILYAEYGKSREIEAKHEAEITLLHERLQEQKARLDAMSANQPTATPSTPQMGQRKK